MAKASHASAVDGLARLGNPNYLHKYYVDATPEVVDVDFNQAAKPSRPPARTGIRYWSATSRTRIRASGSVRPWH